MKKKLFIITLLLFVSAVVHAQWTINGSNINTTYTGSVTIGSTAPYTIHPSAALFPSATPKLEVITGTGGSTPFADLITIRRPGATPDVVSRQLGMIFKLSSEGSAGESDKMGGLLFESPNAYANYPTMSLVTANIRRLTIDQNGKIGIGTTTPISTFQINNSVYKLSFGNAPGADLHYGTGYIGFNAARIPSSSSPSTWTIDGDGYHNGGGVIYTDVFGSIYLAPLASNGTATRTLADADIKNSIVFRVDANGTTYAKAITVQTTGWPDYVFKKDYTLPSLTDVKTYIDQNQHLPEIPSAQQIEKDGINVGEMNKLLLKKVEELTLYLIESQKQAQLQQQQINQLKEQMKSVTKQ